MTQQLTASAVAAGTPPAVIEPRADRLMRRLLRIPGPAADRSLEPSAHRAFRLSLVISGIRCLATYLLVPLLVPVVSLASVLSAPLGILLCLVAFVSGTAGVRRFWRADHKMKWTYTWFMVAVFVVLTVALCIDIARLVQL